MHSSNAPSELLCAQVDDLSIREVQALVQAGTIKGGTMVWADQFAKFIPYFECKQINELSQALEMKYCDKLVYRQESGEPSAPVTTEEAMQMIRSGKLDEDTAIMTASDNHLVSSTNILETVRAMKRKVDKWTPLGEVKHVFGLAEYIPLADDDGGVAHEKELGSPRAGAAVEGFASNLESMFEATAWQGGLDAGTMEDGAKKLRGMNATSKKAALRLKKRAEKMLNSERAQAAKRKAEAAAADMKANETVRADKMLDLAANILGDFGGESVDDAADSKGDADAMISNLKTQYSSEFELRRAALMQKMGGGNTQKLAKVQKRAEVLQGEAVGLFSNVKTPDEALDVMRKNPQFLQSVNKVVFQSIEDLVKGVELPTIAGQKDWGTYSISNMAVKKFARDPRIEIDIKDSVRIEIRDIELEFEHFDFFLDRRVFPKVKDTGKGSISCNCWAYLEFQIGLDKDRKLEIQKFDADVTIEALPMAVVKCNHKHVFKTLMKMFKKKGKDAAQDEIRGKVQEGIPMVRQKITALFEQFGGEEKMNELKEKAQVRSRFCSPPPVPSAPTHFSPRAWPLMLCARGLLGVAKCADCLHRPARLIFVAAKSFLGGNRCTR